ncbi:MAG TPA: TetR/AcrR family transcriptional regulator [Gemmataceae bacterium]|nr:TetR/AcrR family transcriptional regulator [Gemmataceae bacterium]
MPPVTRPRGRPKDPDLPARRRAAILRAAVRVFARRGYRDTNLQDVADALGVAKGTLYLYYRGKEQLFLAAVDHGMVRLRDYVRSAYSDVPDPLDRLAVAVRAYLEFFRDHPDLAELLIQERAEFRDRKTPTYHEHRRTNESAWRDVFADLIDAGRVRRVPVDRILDVIGDLVYGTMFTNHFTGRHRSARAQARDVTDVIFNGILTATERRRRAGKAGA